MVASWGSDIIVVPRQFPSSISRFAADGSWIGTLGGEGDAPGKFRRIRAVAGHNDSLYVFDQRTSRLTVFTPAGALARTAPTSPVSLTQVPAPVEGWGFLINSTIATPDLAGFALHVINLDGEVTRSLDEVRDPNDPYAAFGPGAIRIVAERIGGGYWVVGYDQYVVRELSSSFELGPEQAIEVPWLGQPSATTAGSYIVDAREVSDGTLLTLGHLRDADWQSALGLGGRERRITSYSNYIDSVLELTDLRTGESLGTLVVDDVITRLLPGPRAVVANEDPLTGIVTLRVDSVRFGR
jgi:hypothetical protein